jgi:hypothetical protein
VRLGAVASTTSALAQILVAKAPPVLMASPDAIQTVASLPPGLVRLVAPQMQSVPAGPIDDLAVSPSPASGAPQTMGSGSAAVDTLPSSPSRATAVSGEPGEPSGLSLEAPFGSPLLPGALLVSGPTTSAAVAAPVESLGRIPSTQGSHPASTDHLPLPAPAPLQSPSVLTLGGDCGSSSSSSSSSSSGSGHGSGLAAFSKTRSFTWTSRRCVLENPLRPDEVFLRSVGAPG